MLVTNCAMTDDIVTRLRGMVWDIRCSKMDSDDVGDIVETCLDEIERLRTLGDALAATGGQHGFDEALDAWKDYRHG